MRSAWLVLGMLFLVAATNADAQAPDTVVVGDRVRITTANGTFIGELVSLESSLLQVALGRGVETRTLARTEIERIQLSVGREGRGAGPAFLVGAGALLIGGVIGAATHDPPPNECALEEIPVCIVRAAVDNRMTAALGGAALGGLIGLPLAILVGSSEREAWRNSELGTGSVAHVALTVSPVIRPRVGLVAAWRVTW